MHSKNQLRAELKRLAALNQTNDSKAVVDKLSRELENLPQRTVAAYMALPGEVDLQELFQTVDKDWVFPRVNGEHLHFYRVRNFQTDMQIGAFGILEPKDGLEEVSADAIDIFLCPGLGFDRQGGRLGRGKGFYDRMLEKAKPSAIKIGVCYPFQIVDRITMETHDVRMDKVVG